MTVIYAQIKSGQKLHLVCEAGEEDRGAIILKGHLGVPLCGKPIEDDHYRMTCNLPLPTHSCENCQRIYRSKVAA